MDKPYRVLGVGDACIDLFIPVSEEFLSHVPGKKGGAEAIEMEKLKQIIAASKTSPYMAAGGSCANTIKGLVNLGEPCAFLSSVGSDSFGEFFTASMKELGIELLFSKSNIPTTLVLCLVTPDGQRTMRFCSDSIASEPNEFLHREYFKGVKIVHFDAYTLRNGNLTKKAMQLAKEAHAKVSIDLSSFEIVQEYHAKLTELLKEYVDIVFSNKDETQALTGLSPAEGCLKLQEMCSIAVVLMGDEGCLVGHQGEYFHSPSYSANIVDSTGAGDLFASGFLYGCLHKYPLTKCARLGNRLGSAIVEVQGAEFSSEKWKTVRAALREESLILQTFKTNSC
jgi:sugar/nucleoside kinase (ribokinase family)